MLLIAFHYKKRRWRGGDGVVIMMVMVVMVVIVVVMAAVMSGCSVTCIPNSEEVGRVPLRSIKFHVDGAILIGLYILKHKESKRDRLLHTRH